MEWMHHYSSGKERCWAAGVGKGNKGRCGFCIVEFLWDTKLLLASSVLSDGYFFTPPKARLTAHSLNKHPLLPGSPIMSGTPVSYDTSHPPHGHPENKGPSTQNVDRASTASHPPSSKPDPTTTAAPPKQSFSSHGAQGSQSAASSSSPAQLSHLKVRLRESLRQYPDFPSAGILFEDIMPIFSSPKLHADLIQALELEIRSKFDKAPDVLVGLESRGFLFGPSLALRLNAGFVPVRKQGKLPGVLETEGYQKEYGTDFFQIQSDAIKKGQTVLVVDDIMATGMFLFLHNQLQSIFSN
jgi:adenine phosphoribosyltransferase